MNKGDIVLLPFPFSDLKEIKNRPALILANSSYSVVASFITTQTKWIDRFDMYVEPNSANGLKSNSLIKLTKITTIDKDLILGRLGSLTNREVLKVNEKLVKMLRLD